MMIFGIVMFSPGNRSIQIEQAVKHACCAYFLSYLNLLMPLTVTTGAGTDCSDWGIDYFFAYSSFYAHNPDGV